MDIIEAGRRLSMLELAGAVERIEGNRYITKEH
jgi:hypothetical protein